MALDLKTKWKLGRLWFEEQKDKTFRLKSGKYITVVFPDKTYTDNITDKIYSKEMEKALGELGIKKVEKKLPEVKIDTSNYVKTLKSNDFYYDDDVDMYCKDFKDHSVCLNMKNLNVMFYCDDLKIFNKDFEGRKQRWVKRFRGIGIEINGFYEKTEEYE